MAAQHARPSGTPTVPTEILTASVVGGGGGGRLSMNGLTQSPHFRLIAAADLRPDVCASLRAEFPGLQTFASHEEMFAQCPTEIVCVSTFPPSHREVTLAALKLPLKGILVEKPLGDTYAAGREILTAIRAKKIPVCVPHGLLVAFHAVEILRRVREGVIGRLDLVEIECDKWDLMNAGIHWLNFAVVLAQSQGHPFEAVLCSADAGTRTYRDGLQVETEAMTTAYTAGGLRVMLHSGDYIKIRDGKGTLFRLIGNKGRIEFYGWESCYFLQNADHPAGTLLDIPRDSRGFHQAHLDRLAADIAAGKPDYAVAESSLAALELVEAAYQSHRHRCRVPLPLEKFTPPAVNDWDPGKPYTNQPGGRDGRKLS
ncbi:MAG TPA: Gfo/Idh/MocA family oxidoreductase [Planctomycetota bacterium]|nr:Gfo/Idh/MocA family oxidoreductase [Planctomycetota bacterium]